MFERIASLEHVQLIAFLKMFSTKRIRDIEITFCDTHGYGGVENPAGYSIRTNSYSATGVTLATLESDFADENIQITKCTVHYDEGYSKRIDIDCLSRELIVYNDETIVPIPELRKAKMIGRYEFWRKVEYRFVE